MPKVYCSSIIFVALFAFVIIPTEAIRGALFRSGRSGAFARQRPNDIVELINPDIPVDSLAYSMLNNYPDTREEQSLFLRRIQSLLENTDTNENRQQKPTTL
uniref:Uncharacterized protein n=1 Tax=Panagrolaimus davidi TaxID=227884 RepID=A0A914QNH5_9BILA